MRYREDKGDAQIIRNGFSAVRCAYDPAEPTSSSKHTGTFFDALIERFGNTNARIRPLTPIAGEVFVPVSVRLIRSDETRRRFANHRANERLASLAHLRAKIARALPALLDSLPLTFEGVDAGQFSPLRNSQRIFLIPNTGSLDRLQKERDEIIDALAPALNTRKRPWEEIPFDVTLATAGPRVPSHTVNEIADFVGDYLPLDVTFGVTRFLPNNYGQGRS